MSTTITPNSNTIERELAEELIAMGFAPDQAAETVQMLHPDCLMILGDNSEFEYVAS